MVGAIDKRDILAHPIVTIQCFGWRVFLRALLAGRNTTFLSVLTATEALKPAAETVVEFVARCVELELTASRIYAALARRFANTPDLYTFFASISGQEESHAELLELCRAAAAQSQWLEEQIQPWRRSLPQLERHMADAESRVDDVHSALDALRLVIEIESSEINDVFRSIVTAADSEFVRRVNVFGDTERRHLSFIGHSIVRLEPSLAEADRALAKRAA